MSEAIIVALITGGCGVLAQWLIGSRSRKDQQAQLEKHQAVTDTKIDELTRKVEKHNNLIERTYKLEGAVNELQHDVRDLKGAKSA